MKNKLWVLLAVLVVAGAGAWYGMSQSSTNTNSTANANASANANVIVDQCASSAAVTANVNGSLTVPTIVYSGMDGKDALTLLQAHHHVEASSAGFVNTIDGIKPGDHQFWLLCVNGKGAEVGAKDLTTKTTDTIEWQLGTF